jgi:flagellin
MSFSINTNVGALAALQSLDSTQQSLNNTQNVIASGLLVGSASDNPAVYSISQTMQANISGLTAVQDNLSFGNSVLGVAAAAGSQISSQLATLQNTVTQAQQTGISSGTMNKQIGNILNNIDNFANNATFNGVNLLATNTTTGVNTTNMVIQDTINAGGQLSVTNQLGTNTSMTQALGLTNLTAAAGGLQFSFNSSYAPAAGDYLQLSNGTNNYVFEFQTTGAAPVAAPSSYLVGSNTTGGTNSLTNVIMGTSTSPMAAVGALISSLQQNGFAASLSNSGNLTIAGNGVTGTGSAWEKTGTAYASTATVTVPGAGGEVGVTGTTLGAGAAAITLVQNAVTSMNTIAATIGATQQEVTGMMNFSSSLSTSLTTGSGALIDANMASESAQLNSLQTKQQLAIRTLSIANAQPQVLLNLFQ